MASEYNEYSVTDAFNAIHNKNLIGGTNQSVGKRGQDMSFLELILHWKEINHSLDEDYIRKANQVHWHMSAFEKDYLKKPIEYSDITYEFLNQYTGYIATKKKKRKDPLSLPFSNHTIRDHIKIIKQVIHLARSYGKTFEYRVDKFKVKTKSLNKHFIEKEELKALEEVKVFSTFEEQVKDWWLFQLYIGCRYSDLPGIDIKNVENAALKYFKEKQNEMHEVVLTKKAYLIIKKYETFPLNSKGKPLNIQRINKVIKTLARRAKINKLVEYAVESGGQVHKVDIEKWKVIGTHTARRTQARLRYDEGKDLMEIRDILGQKNIKTTEEYIGKRGRTGKQDFADDIV
jgi:site-specific recombinase XerD